MLKKKLLRNDGALSVMRISKNTGLVTWRFIIKTVTPNIMNLKISEFCV